MRTTDCEQQDLLRAFLAGLALLAICAYVAPPGSAEMPAGESAVTIRTYLSRQASRITDGAVHNLPRTARAWEKQRPERLGQYYEMMGIDHLMAMDKRPPLNVRVTGTLDRERYRIEKIYYESLPKLYVTANLYIPKDLKGRAPAVLYVCGHSQTQKVNYQPHARRWAELGFVTLIVDTVQFGEIKGHHHGCYAMGWFNWYSRGYTPGGVELWNGIRGVDLLQSRPEVDPERIGVTGISGGGAMSWWLGAADERVKAVAPVCGTGTIKSHVAERTVDGHCDCMYHINYYGWDLADVGALIAPRPLLVASSNRDGLYSIESIKECCTKIEKVYGRLGAGKNFRFVETPGPHSYHPTSRRAIFAWFMKHLTATEVDPETIADVDERNEAEKDLLVYGDKPPADERVTTVQDWFIPVAEPPAITDTAALEAARKRIVAELRKRTFRHFPAKPCPLRTRVVMRDESDGTQQERIVFQSEEGIELTARLIVPEKAATEKRAPCLVFLRSPRSGRWEAEGFVGRLDPTWARLVVNTRGVWETAWGEDLQWHIRRASAITGRTVASMRVYDALRALEVARSLPQIDRDRVAIGGKGEMAAVAAYAALLDAGNVSGLVMADPPASLNEPSEKDGTGAAVELLGALRTADLPVVAGLLWPNRIAFVGTRPSAYDWTADLYRRLRRDQNIATVADLSAWKE